MNNAVTSTHPTDAGTSQGQYYTVPEAARLLQVSPSTIWRWIHADRLPAYRIGQKTIRVKRADLEAAVRPIGHREAQRGEVSPMKETLRTTADAGPAGVGPLTADEATRGLAALQRARALTDAMRVRRGGQRLPSSVDLLRQEREARGQQL